MAKHTSLQTSQNDLTKNITKNNCEIIRYSEKVLFEGSKKEFGSQQRGFFVRTYLPTDKLIEFFQYADHYAIIEHDKDEGTTHRHFIVRFKNPVNVGGFCKKLNNPDEQSYVRVLHDKYSAFDYLLHRDEKSVAAGKYRYDEKQVLTDDYSYWQRSTLQEQKQANDKQFLDDLLAPKINLRYMGETYGRDFMKNMSKYLDYRKAVLYDEDMEKYATLCSQRKLWEKTATATLKRTYEELGAVMPFESALALHSCIEEIYSEEQFKQFIEDIEMGVVEI